MPSSSASVVMTARSSPASSRCLDLAPLGRRVAGAVGRDALASSRRCRAARARRARSGSAARRPCASARSRSCGRRRATSRASELGRLRRAPSGARPSASSMSGGFQIAISPAAPTGEPSSSISVHVLEAGQALGELDRVGDRRRGEQEARLGAVRGGDPAQPPQHVRDVRAEHAAVDVRLVDDDDREVREQAPPRRRGGAGSRRAACRGW